MKIDLNALTVDVERNLANYSSKLPPKLHMGIDAALQKADSGKVTKAITRRLSDERAVATLVKSEVMVSAYDNGELRFDFGENVPDKVKRMAMEWAKKRGLRPVEASLSKNERHGSSMIFSSSQVDPSALCLTRIRWSVQ